MCQRDFVCQYPTRQHINMKKHVLVCDQHKTSQQNKDFLEHYKSRCILRQPVPIYSKEIKLSFHSINDSKDNNAIFMLQTIQIDGEASKMFYDSGCSDFVSRYHAIKRLGQRW